MGLKGVMCRGGERNKWSQSGWPKLMSHSQAGRQVCKERLIFCVLKEPHLTSPHLTAGAEVNKMLTLHTPHTLHTPPPHTHRFRQQQTYSSKYCFWNSSSCQTGVHLQIHIKFKLKGQFTPKKKKRKFRQRCYVLLLYQTSGPTLKYIKCILKYNI